VKHSPDRSQLAPLEIGKTSRRLIEAFLHTSLDSIQQAFPERIEKLATTLALWGSKMNLTAHPDDPEEIVFHVIDCLMPMILAADQSSILFDKFSQRRTILDLGSGAGFPGLILAAASLANFTLVESRRKRVSFLNVAVAEMGLKNVLIEAVRAEDFSDGKRFDVITARAFGNPAEFFTLAAPLLERDGLAMLYANPSQTFGHGVECIPYDLERRGAKIHRILATCRQLVEEPRGRN
jgi:16S rRNA (guanine(527)-N(7))-methyltransferase RsmG